MSILSNKLSPLPRNPWQIAPNMQLTEEQAKTLSGMSVYTAVPMYGGMCLGQFTGSITDLYVNFANLGMNAKRQFLYNESLVQRARNSLVHCFLKSDCEYLFFIDADIAFNAQQALEMLLAARLGNHKLIGASYPLKMINWHGVREAVRQGVPDEGLWHCSGQHVVRLKEGQTVIKDWFAPVPAKYLATGFLLIHRSVFDAMRTEKLAYRLNQRMPGCVMGETAHAYFDCLIDETGEYLSEDYLFSKRCTELGIESMLCPWIYLTHTGTISFEGCLTCSSGSFSHQIGQGTYVPAKPLAKPTIK